MIENNDIKKYYSASGLIDLQVNGVNGVDFNDAALTKEDVRKATEYLLSRGVTTYFPTVITNSEEQIIQLFTILSEACDTYPLVRECVGGFHLEGPFISPKEGAKGAHDEQFIKPPEWNLFQKFQKAAKGNIKIITIAPEWEEAAGFIKKCRENGVLVSMGHSLANTSQINEAADAGMTLSTHLGNGIPLMLRRHPNMLWDQLAEDRLWSMLIADGHHLPDTFIKVVMKAKGDKVLLVSDTTRFAGMPPGEYETFIGGSIILDEEKKISLKGSGGLLAGAAKDLLECVETMVNHKLASIETAWEMASVRIHNMLACKNINLQNGKEDVVEFKKNKERISICKVIKNSKVVFESEALKGQG